MSRRLIIIEDDASEFEADNLEEALELLHSQGLKAYAASSLFEMETPYTNKLTSQDLENLPLPSSQGEQIALETLLLQKTILENELRKLRTLIENSGDLMYAIDFGGNITFISNNVVDFLGYAPQEVIGRNFLSLITLNGQKKAGERFAQQMAGTAKGPFTTELTGKNGRVVPVEVNGRNYYEHNTAVLNIGLVRDISIRKAMQAEVLKRNRELTALYSVASVLSQSLDMHELLQECLDRMLETIGVETGGMLLLKPNGEFRLSAARGIDEDFEALFRPLQNDLKIVRQVMVSGEVVIIENVRDLKPLDPALIERIGYNSLVMGPLRAKDRVLGSFVLASKGPHRFVADDRELILSIGNQVGMALQIAELYAELNNTVQELRLTNTQLEEATRHKSEFLANMSHELRTPLNAIIGFSELLLDQTFGPLNEKQNRYVDNIFNSGKHLLALVNDVLDVAKVEAGKMELQMDKLVVRDVVNDVVNAVAPLALKKQIALATSLSETAGQPATQVIADNGRLKQILYNLLSNAIKFTPENGLVQIQSRVVQKNKTAWLELSISDNGIGIKTEDISRIFEEFQMADSTLARRQQGTGLGLALSRRLANLHGGEISVKSVFGSGSTFTLTIPLEPIAKEPEAQPVVFNHLNLKPDRSPQEEVALVIEDEDQSAELLQLYMDQAGYRVVRCNNGDQALEIAKQLMPSVITLDVVLPTKNGWDVLRELKDDPATRDIPVMIVSMVDNAEVSSSFRMGAVAYFVKPVRKAELLAKLSELQVAALHERRRKHSRQHHENGQPLQALVIDDNEPDREMVRATLEAAGMTVETAENGKAGWTLARRNPPDLVVLDLVMPEADGFQVLKELRQHLSTMDIPVFIFTAKELNSSERDQLSEAEVVLQKGEASGKRLLQAVSRLEESELPPE